MNTTDDDVVKIRAAITRAEHRRAKAAAALAGEDFQDWAGEAVRRRLAEDEAARRQAEPRQTEEDN
jgi:hypothetical protein